MEKKTFEFEIKEFTEEGRFSGYLSTFGNVDAGGDMVDAGAFKKTLREHKSFGFIWGHQPTVEGIVGSFAGKEDKVGLFIEGGFYLDLESGLKAHKTAKRLQTDGVHLGLSMGYNAINPIYQTIEGRMVRRLKEVKLNEGSITLWPMNDRTNLAVKEEGQTEGELEAKPSAENHLCRKASGDYIRYRSETRKHEGKTYTVRYGITKAGKAEESEYFYPVAEWSAAEARAHCKKNDGSFEAALKKGLTAVCKSCGETVTLTEPADATQPGADFSKAEPVNDHSENASLLSPVIEGLEAGRAKPQHLFKRAIDTLEKS